MRKAKMTAKQNTPSSREPKRLKVVDVEGKSVTNSKELPYKMKIAEPQPAFPSDISIDDARLRLHADGSYEGDADKFLEAAKTLKISDGDGILVVAVWCIINSIKKNA